MKKNYTFIVTSDHKGTTLRYMISGAWVKSLFVVGIVLAVIGAATMVDYIGLLFQSVENKRLKAENVQLKNQFAIVESKLASLEKNMERINSYTAKLSLITGPTDGDNTLRLAMGPIAQSNFETMQLNMEERKPASVVASEDKAFFDSAPLDVNSGEIFAARGKNYATISIRMDKLSKESKLKEQNILNLWESLSNRQSLLKATPSLKPTNGWYTSRFGYRKSPFTGRLVMHNGLDIAAGLGTPIYASGDGVVSYSGYDSGYGKLISVDHGYGMVTRYGHISKLYAKKGQKVKRGDIIGAVGNTGRSTGPHLHYEVRVNGVPVDPSNYVLHE